MTTQADIAFGGNPYRDNGDGSYTVSIPGRGNFRATIGGDGAAVYENLPADLQESKGGDFLSEGGGVKLGIGAALGGLALPDLMSAYGVSNPFSGMSNALGGGGSGAGGGAGGGGLTQADMLAAQDAAFTGGSGLDPLTIQSAGGAGLTSLPETQLGMLAAQDAAFTGGGLDPLTQAALGGAGGTAAFSLPSWLAQGAQGAGSTFLSRLLGLNPDLLKAGGALGSTLLGLAGADNQRSSLNQQLDLLKPTLQGASGAYLNALNNPNSWYQSAPAMGASDAAARALSINGNPAGSPGDIAKLASYNLGGYNDYLRSTGNTAIGAGNTVASLTPSVLGTSGQGLNALGSGLAQLTNPTPSLADTLQQLGLGNQNQNKLFGGT